MKEFALCIQGGGSRGSYAAGVLDVLMREGLWAGEVIGTSAGALAGCNYVSRDIGRNDKLFMAMMKDRRFFKPGRLLSKSSMFDFHYLFHNLLNHGMAFDFDEFRRNECQFLVVASNCLSGATDYFEKNDGEFWNALAASASLPLTSRPVFVHKVPYLDGGISCPIGFEKALSDGYEKVVVVATRKKGFRKSKMTFGKYVIAKKMYSEYPLWLQTYQQSPQIYNSQMELMDNFAKTGRLFVIYPSQSPKVRHAEKNSQKIQELIRLGTQDIESLLPSLKQYLSK
jgi:predicted patatin/cPLA2 family phospholipase